MSYSPHMKRLLSSRDHWLLLMRNGPRNPLTSCALLTELCVTTKTLTKDYVVKVNSHCILPQNDAYSDEWCNDDP